jgi:hypothetical protein
MISGDRQRISGGDVGAHVQKGFWFVGFVSLTVAFAEIEATGLARAQAGSTGGVLGKTDKSASGGEEQTTNPPPPVKRALNHTSEPKSSRCPNIVGVWDSWASGLFGKADATFNKDGTAMHRSGISGKWWCDNGHLWLKWTTSDPHEVQLVGGGKKIIVASDGHLVFSRE